MRRTMVWIGIPWLAGLFLGATCRTSVTMCLLPAAFMLLGAFRLFRRITTGQALCIGISLTAAVGAVMAYSALVYAPVAAHDGTMATFSGKVASVTVYDNDRASYQVKGEFADGTSAKILVYTSDLGARYGDQLDVAGEFSTPEVNYLWDSKAYYQAKGIFLEASSDAFVQCTPTENGKLIRMLQAYRERISTRICVLAGTDAGGMVSAMLLGTKETISDETDQLMTHHGIRHVVSVSGLHLVLLLSVWMWFCQRLHLHRWLSFGSSGIWVLLYALMMGTPVSIVRAGIMYLLMQSAPLFFRRGDTCNSLCFAGILLTVGNPYLILDASFLLSMAGTFGIGVFAPWLTKKMQQKKFPMSTIRRLTALSCVSVCIFPVTMFYFRKVSVAAPVANLLLVPICSLMLTLSLGIFLTGGVGFVAKPICLLLRWLYDLLMLFAYGLRELVPVMFPTGWDMLPILTGLLTAFVLLTFLQKHSRRAVAGSLVLSFVILLVGQMVYRMGERNIFTIAVLGQKQEMVLAVTYQGKTDIIDLTGHHKNPDYVQAYLSERGIRRLDSLCLTKRADQMRIAYPTTLGFVEAEETAVPTDCWIPSDADLMGTVPQQTDALVLRDMQYAITLENGVVEIEYGTLRFCIGTKLSELPEGTWDGVICTAWNGEADVLPEQTYCKETSLCIRVREDGSWNVEELI